MHPVKLSSSRGRFTVFLALLLSLGVAYAFSAQLRASFARLETRPTKQIQPQMVGSAASMMLPMQGCTVNCGATVPATGTTGQAVAFSATGSASGCATGPTFLWSFGDGTTSTQQNPSKTYNSSGPFNWQLTVSASQSGGGGSTISTAAGGESEGSPANGASFYRLNAVARDPLGRGIYLAAANFKTHVIYFVNTGNSSATLAGKTIAPGITRILAGGGNLFPNENLSGLDADLSLIYGLAVSNDGNIVYFTEDASLRALNVGTVITTIGGGSLAPGNVKTVASGQFGTDLNGVAVSPIDGFVFVSDATSGIHKVFRVDPTSGTVSTVAGNGAFTMEGVPFVAGPATGIPLLQPRAIEIEANGNLVIADTGHRRVIRVSAGFATLVAQLSSSGLNPYPNGVALFGGNVYVANGNEQTVQRVNGGIQTVAGQAGVGCDYGPGQLCGDGGPASGAAFNFFGGVGTPQLAGIEGDTSGLFVIDQPPAQRARVRFINLSGGSVTVAGTSVAAGGIQTIAGNGSELPFDGGPASSALLSRPVGVAADANNNLWITEQLGGDRVRFVNRGGSQVTLFPGTFAQQTVAPGAIVSVNKDNDSGVGGDVVPANQAAFSTPQGIFATSQGVYVADSLGGATVPPGFGGRHTSLLRFINTSSSTITFFASSASPVSVPPGNTARIAGCNLSDSSSCNNNGFALSTRLLGVSDVVVTPGGDIVFTEVGFTDTGHSPVRRLSASTGNITDVSVPFSRITGLGISASGRLYGVDTTSANLLRETSVGSGSLTVFVSGFSSPRDVAIGSDNTAYVTQAGNHRIRQVTDAGVASDFAGTTLGFSGDGGAATAARLNLSPPTIEAGVTVGTLTLPETVNISVSPSGDIFFADVGNNRIRRIGGGAAPVTCTRTGSITVSSASNPVPVLTSLVPSTLVAGGAGFQLTVNGSNFVNGSVVRWNGSDRTTGFVSANQVTAQINAADIAVAGAASVTVFNPAPGGGLSNALTFTTTNPAPTLTGLIPASAIAGAAGFMLTINGTNFVSSSQARWNGGNRTTTFVNSTTLQAAISTADLASQGTAAVTVLNPVPGGGTSNSLNFTISPSGQALEGDVAPRPGGNGVVSLADYVQIGRFAAFLDTVTVGSEFQKADCAPRSTLGDGNVSLADWVQAGRWAAGLDLPVPAAGGPTGSFSSVEARAAASDLVSSPEQDRILRAKSTTITRGTNGQVEIEIVSQGNENAFSFTVNFDPTQMTFSSAALGSGVPVGTALIQNTGQTASGRYGAIIGLPISDPPTTLTAGTRQLLVLTFTVPTGPGTSTAVSFGDVPVPRQVVDGLGEALPTTFSSGTITLTGSNNPVPTLSSLSPNQVNAGSGGFTLTANGANFAANAVVNWNGSPRTTGFNNSGQLTAQITATDVQNAGSALVTVFNPAPGGGTSNSLTFTINAQPNPLPSITSLNPSFAIAGAPPFTLTVNGTNFIGGSVVRWNGSNRPTSFVNSTQLTAQISAADIAAVGTQSVTVFNPSPGGGTSNVVAFPVNTTPTSVVRVVGTTIQRGQNGTIAVELVSTGFENAVGFTLSWDTSQLSFVSASAGSGTAGAGVIINSGQAGSGLLGVNIAQNPGVTFSAGTRQLLTVVLTALPGVSASTQINFVDSPVLREVINVSAFALPASFASGTVAFTGGSNPVPTLSSLSPNQANAGSPGFTLTVNGSNFAGNAVVNWNGSPRTTVFNNSGQLTAQITATDVQNVGSASVTVFNPAPGGGTSNSLTFTIIAQPNPLPTVSNLSPNSAAAGSPGFTLTVNGTNFVAGSAVQWNGSPRTTVFNSALQLTAQITAADVQNIGSASVTVFNPAPGGGTSNSVTFTINTQPNPLPTISNLSPNSAAAGSPGFTLTVNGTNFVAGSLVQWNGSARTTVFNNSGQLTAQITATDVQNTGSANVTVFSPAPGGGTSNSVTFTISVQPNPLPTVTNLTPNSAPAGSPGFTLTVNGTNFVAGSVVQWNGSARTTVFNNSGQLTAQITAADVQNTGSANVTVFNPAPGGGTSNSVTFTINVQPNPVPTVSNLSQTFATAGSAGFTLTVNGTNFVPSSVVQWNGLSRTTTFINSGQLNASIGAGDLANPGTASVNVFTPTPGGGTSNSVDFVIGTSTALPVITQLDPSAALAGGPQFALRVIGANFTSSSNVRWNGQSRTTTFDNSGQLTAIIPASDIATGGTASVTVTNPGVDGGTSNTATFSISGPNGVPALVSLNPGSIAAGSPAFTLTVTGTGFVSGAIVQINGSNRSTTFVNATTLTAQIPASDVAVSGSATVRALNPEPGGGFSNELTLNIAPGNPVPTLSSLSPNTVLAGSGAFTLTVNGLNFVTGAVVQWNGSARATTFGGSSVLTAQISAADVANAGSASVSVLNPGPGGGVSNALTFTITGPNPTPVLQGLNPPAAVVGGPGFTLIATGANFVNGSVVLWNGSPRTTGFVNSAQLTAEITAADIASVGTASITVFNPAPGGGTSNALSFVVGTPNPAPVLGSLNPPSIAARGNQFTLTVTGSGFVPGSIVQWNGGSRPTGFVNSTMLTAQIPASDIIFPGTASITVFNPLPGGGTSTALSFTITNPVPGLLSLNPNSVGVGSQGFTLQVTGVNFVENSVVRWNGNDRPTSFINNALLNAQISTADLATAGTAVVTVFTPAPGGGSSNSLNFTIAVPNPAPTLTSLSPPFAIVGGPDFDVTITGANFVQGSVVQWNGLDRPTTFLSSTMLRARIPRSDISFAGSASIRIFNPTPGGGLSLAVRFTIARALAQTNAASFVEGQAAPESIIAAFGEELATGTASGATVPPPTSLLGTSVQVRDQAGVVRLARLFAVSPGQVNYEMPAGTALGTATVTITNGDGVISIGLLQVTAVAPGIFSASSNGQGLAAAQLLRIRANGTQSFENTARFDTATGQFVPVPIDLGPDTDQIFLIFYGTGIRGRTSLAGVNAQLGGVNVGALFAGAAPGFFGLDQVNTGRIPRSFVGRGLVGLVLTVDGRVANVVQVSFR